MPDLNFDISDKEHTILAAEWEVEHEDIFHLKNLYKLCYEWFQDNGFQGVENPGVPISPEVLYQHRVNQNGNVDQNMWWRLFHVPNKSTYFRYFIRFDFQTINMGKTKVDVRGVQMSSNQGDLIIRCKAYLVVDYDRKFKKDKFLSIGFISNWFRKRLYRDQIEYHRKHLYVKIYELQSLVKQYMKLKNPHEMQRPFHPEGGL